MAELTTIPEGAASLVDVDVVALRVDDPAARGAAGVASRAKTVVGEAVHVAVAPLRRQTPKQDSRLRVGNKSWCAGRHSTGGHIAPFGQTDEGREPKEVTDDTRSSHHPSRVLRVYV